MQNELKKLLLAHRSGLRPIVLWRTGTCCGHKRRNYTPRRARMCAHTRTHTCTHAHRQVQFEEAAAFAQERGIPYCEVSALDGARQGTRAATPFFVAVSILARNNRWVDMSMEQQHRHDEGVMTQALKQQQWLTSPTLPP